MAVYRLAVWRNKRKQSRDINMAFSTLREAVAATRAAIEMTVPGCDLEFPKRLKPEAMHVISMPKKFPVFMIIRDE